MITLPEEKVLYSEIQKKLFYIIPEKWDKIYLYASVVDIPNSRPKGEMYFYYLPKGILKKKNGDIYEGEWKNGEFNGKGIYKYNNGNKYEGEFKDGNKDGKGIFTNKNGEQIIGLWKNDEKQ